MRQPDHFGELVDACVPRWERDAKGQILTAWVTAKQAEALLRAYHSKIRRLVHATIPDNVGDDWYIGYRAACRDILEDLDKLKKGTP